MITIYKNRIIYTAQNNTKSKVSPKNLFYYLGDTVKLDKSVTFATIMNLLKENVNLVNMVYGHTLGGYEFHLFYEDFLKPISKKEKNDYKTEYLEVYYYPDLFKYEKNEKFELNHAWDIHLIKTGKKENVPYGISFAKLSDFKKHPVRINDNVDFFAHDSTKKFTKKSLSTPLIKTTMGGVKLFDFIWAILYEISWMGSPDSRNQKGKELQDQVHDIESGNAELIPWDEAMKGLTSKTKKKKK